MNIKARAVRFVFGWMIWMVLLSLLTVACSATSPGPLIPLPGEEATQAPTEPAVTEVSATEVSVTELPATKPPAPAGPSFSGISPDPQRVEFQAEDGKKLVGYYYPSKYADAPIIILMHWVRGDLCDWRDIALWLQNRADENPAKLERCAIKGADRSSLRAQAWWDPNWFPPMASDVSIAVFAFDFRGFGESDAGRGQASDWAKDAHAAFKAAAGLKGVDTAHMAAMGASIGADGAADGCLLYNQEIGSGCVGAFSLSPGNYLYMEYATVVDDLAPIPVWCLAGELDGPSAAACKRASGGDYRAWIYPDSQAHGMSLISSEVDPPQPMELIQEFIELVLGDRVKAE